MSLLVTRRAIETISAIALISFSAMSANSTTSDRIRKSTAVSDSVAELDRMIVTATRTPKKQENVPAVVTLISKEQIEATPARTVGDLINNLPGITAFEPQGSGVVTPQTQMMRGNGFPGHSMILLDGQPLNTPFTDYAYLTTVPVHAVERVEVIRGSFSALYGSSAGGGIINIITKAGGPSSYVEPWGQFGDFGRYGAGLNLGIKRPRLSLGFFADGKLEDNYFLYNDSTSDTTNRNYSHIRLHTKILTFLLDEKLQLSLSGGGILGRTGFGLSTTYKIENHQDMLQPYANLQASMKLNPRTELYGQIDWLKTDHTYYGETLERFREFLGVTDPVFVPSKNTTKADRYRGDISASVTVLADHVITGGMEVMRINASKVITDTLTGRVLDVQGRAGESCKVSENQASGYLQYDATFLQRLELVLGGRYDYFDSYGSEFSPKATLRVCYLDQLGVLDDGNIKFSIGKGFRAPNLNELHSPPWSITTGMVYQGNPNLKAEYLWSYEGSIEQRAMNKKLSLRISPYITKADNFITSVYIVDPFNPTGKLMFPDNVRDVTMKGVDLEVSWKLANIVTPFVNANYNATIDESTGNIMDGYPKYSGSAGAYLNWQITSAFSLYGSYSIHYKGLYTSKPLGSSVTDTVGNYFIHNMSISLACFKTLHTSINVFNVLDNRSKLQTDRFLPQRNVLTELLIRIPLDGKWPWKKD